MMSRGPATATSTLQIHLHYATPHYITLHPALVVEVTTATIPQNTIPTTFRSTICHQCITTTHLSSPSFQSLKLPPPPCAVLMVYVKMGLNHKFLHQNFGKNGTWFAWIWFAWKSTCAEIVFTANCLILRDNFITKRPVGFCLLK